jgi:hypothetical protein
MIPSAQPEIDTSTPSRAVAAGEIVFLLAVFFIYAGWPTPDVNEPHYLSKAKHYWDADWAAGDFFCESADAHQMFYWTCGWLTLVMPLSAVAWVGRLVTWTLLAWSWRRLSRSCVPRAGWAMLSGTLMLCLLDRCQMAGEWIVGGFEAKGFAYVLVFLGLEALLRGRWNRVWPLLGAAAAFHVLVGGWMVLAAGVAWLLSKQDRPTLRSMIGPLALGLLLALPGLLPALLLTVGADPEMVREANFHYVFHRLKHHLLFTSFKPTGVVSFFAMAAVWAAMCFATRGEKQLRLLRCVTLATLLIAACGIAIDLATQENKYFAASILRYYWFRTADAMLPIAAGLLVTYLLSRLVRARPVWGGAGVAVAMLACGFVLGDVWLDRRDNMRPRSEKAKRIVDVADWHDVCRWATDISAPGDVFLTPRSSQTFRWHTGRAEVVNQKDIPQDAESIVEWWNRLNAIHRYDNNKGKRRWYKSLAEMDQEHLLKMCDAYGASYVITLAKPPLPSGKLRRIYNNDSYAIYEKIDDPP